MFHNPLNSPILVPDDPAVARWVLKLRCQQSSGGPYLLVVFLHLDQSLRRKKWHVPRQHEYIEIQFRCFINAKAQEPNASSISSPTPHSLFYELKPR